MSSSSPVSNGVSPQPSSPSPPKTPTAPTLMPRVDAVVKHLQQLIYQVDVDKAQRDRDAAALTKARAPIKFSWLAKPPALTNLPAPALANGDYQQSGSYVLPAFQDVNTAQHAVDRDNAKIKQDNADIALANSQLKVAKLAQHYQPKAPTITVKNKVTEVVTRKLRADKRAQSRAQTTYEQDESKLDDIKNQHMTEAQDGGFGERRLQPDSPLGRQLTRCTHKETADRQTLNNANAAVAADNTLLYGQQLSSDRAALRKAGLINGDGDLKPGVTLTPQQQADYTHYLAVAATFGKNWAQMQLVVSDPSAYGEAGKKAVTSLNRTLAPLGMYWEGPGKIAVSKARAVANADTNNANIADADWNSVTAQLANTTAQNAALNSPTPANVAAAATAKANFDTASGFAEKLYYQMKLPQDNQAVTRAQAAWKKDKSADNCQSLDKAQVQRAGDQQQQQIGIATFDQGIAETLAVEQPGGPNSPTALQFATAETAVANDDEAMRPPAAPITPSMQKQAAADSDTLTRYEMSPAQLGVSVSQSYTALLESQYDQWLLKVNPENVTALGLPADTTPQDAAGWSQDQVDAAQYSFAHATFMRDQPSNIVNPQTADERTTANQMWNRYADSQHLSVRDGRLASQLEQLAPGQKIDLDPGRQQLSQEQSEETKIMGDRSLLQQGWDGLTGHNKGTQKHIAQKIDQLDTLQNAPNSESAAEFNQQYVSIMGTESTQFDTMTQSQMSSSRAWTQAQDVATDVVMSAVAIAVAAPTFGFGDVVLGAALGFETLQGVATAQNYVTASEGGNVEANSQVSLLAARSNNFGYGGDSHQEKTQSWVDAGVDALTSLGTAVGAEGGGSLGKAASERVLPTLLSKFGVEEEGSIWMRAGSGAIAMTGNQAIMGGTQVVATGINVAYQESQGNISGAEGAHQMNQAFKGASLGVATAPVLGVVSEELPAKLYIQYPANLTTNTALTWGANAMIGSRIDRADWESVTLNSIAASFGGRRDGAADPAELSAHQLHGDLPDLVGAGRMSAAAPMEEVGLPDLDVVSGDRDEVDVELEAMLQSELVPALFADPGQTAVGSGVRQDRQLTMQAQGTPDANAAGSSKPTNTPQTQPGTAASAPTGKPNHASTSGSGNIAPPAGRQSPGITVKNASAQAGQGEAARTQRPSSQAADADASPPEVQEPLDQEVPQSVHLAKKARELYNALPGWLKRKVICISTDSSPKISGFNEIVGYEHVEPARVLEYQAKIGHPVKRSGANDQGVPGQYFASHAERKVVVANPESTQFGVSKAMCSECQAFFSQDAVANERELTVSDSEKTRVFKADGTVTVTEQQK